MNWPFIVGAALGLVVGALGGFAFAAYLVGVAIGAPERIGDTDTMAGLRGELTELDWRARQMLERWQRDYDLPSGMAAVRAFAEYMALRERPQGGAAGE